MVVRNRLDCSIIVAEAIIVVAEEKDTNIYEEGTGGRKVPVIKGMRAGACHIHHIQTKAIHKQHARTRAPERAFFFHILLVATPFHWSVRVRG